MQSNKSCPIIEQYLAYLITVKGRSSNTISEYRLDLLQFLCYIADSRGYTRADFSFADLDFIWSIRLNDMYAFLAYCQETLNAAPGTRYRKIVSMHPHRGIETITYLISGRIDHEDSLGNKGTIYSGECQWMTAGRGILHQEMPKESERMLGFQLWLNLPHQEKMTTPAYCSLTRDLIPTINSGKAEIGVLSGRFGDVAGITPAHIPATIYDIMLPIGEDITVPTKKDETVFAFLIEGDAVINNQTISSKSAILFERGDYITVSAKPESGLRFIFFSGRALHVHHGRRAAPYVKAPPCCRNTTLSGLRWSPTTRWS